MAKDGKNMSEIVNHSNDKLKWFFTFIIFAFISIFLKEIVMKNSTFILFFKKLLGNIETIPYLYNISSIGIGIIIFVISYIAAIIISKPINGTIDDFFELISYKVSNKDERELDDFQAVDQVWF